MATFAWVLSIPKTTFSHAGYATFRPSYPISLYNTVYNYHQGPKDLCVDLGCGHGVVTRYLAKEFKHVLGTDPSKGMVEQAQSTTSSAEYPNVEYRDATAESSPFLEDASVDMAVAGQAAHWFDYPKLFPEMKRVVRSGGTLAFWGYKDIVFVDYPEATKILDDYAYGEGEQYLGDYWQQPGRSVVQNKLRDVKPPASDWTDIQRVEYEPGTRGPRSGEGTMYLTKKLKLGEVMEYVRTWSAYHKWQEEHPQKQKRTAGGTGDVVDKMLDEMVRGEKDWRNNEKWQEKVVEVEWGSGLLLARRK
ncbi:MAG: hypothetical protein M1827_003934 [Pycnora praestabilis]|nr:MAG: hypothetical protein M1827_003934 [Pycnora praestabilis]